MRAIDELKKSWAKIKEFFVNMPKETRKKIVTIAVIVLAVAVTLTLVLNLNSGSYIVLYENITTEEANSVYQALADKGINPRLNEKGQVTVPRGKYNQCLIEMAAEGYPKSSLAYDVFASHSGLTSTESEQKQWLLYQLQDRIQDTLKSMDGIVGATVTISLADDNDYVWQSSADSKESSAGVLLSIRSGTTVTDTQVSAIKTLVASSVPNLSAENVTVVDSSTRVELGATAGADSSYITQTQNLEFEATVRKQIEENIVKVLTPRYGRDGIVATAMVTIDYDKMMVEKMELQEKPVNEDGTGGGGYTTDFNENWNVNGTTTAGGVVGEEDNTDIPQYAYTAPTETGGMTDYSRDIKYDYGYVKTQIEKGNAALKRATVSVLVDDANLTETRRQELTSIISTAVDISPDLIFVSTFSTSGVVKEETPSESQPFWMTLPLWVYIAFAAVFVLMLLFLVLAITARGRSRKKDKKGKKGQQGQPGMMAAGLTDDEIERYKQELSNAARAGSDPKDDAILDEVRDFARTNPEITANLLRSWMKEGE